jgi:leucyl aminopeptidase
VGETPWIHLDIAGTAWLDDAKPYMAKGATGVGLRTFVRLAESW